MLDFRPTSSDAGAWSPDIARLPLEMMEERKYKSSVQSKVRKVSV